MRRGLKIAGLFAALGFFLPLVLLLYYEISTRYMGGTGGGDFLLLVCPTAIASMALDHASTSTAVVVWLIIAISNALLYALAGAVVAFFLSLRKPSRL